ncbi:MAG: phage terminase large subunit [Sulfurimonas sp.]|nr:phage terminase large subunit [Sulfurimonas sp.]
MLFSKEELDSFLEETRLSYELDGKDEKTIRKLTRKDFVDWLDDLKEELRAQILCNATLDPKTRDERVARGEHDFEFWSRTYFPHYFSIPGKNALHEYLEEKFVEITTTLEGTKNAIAAPRGHAKTTYVSQLFPLWCAAYKKKRFIVEISDAVELVEGNLEAIKVELEDNENLKADFPDVCGVGTSWKVGEFVTRNGVKFKAFGSGKRLRGVKFGVYRPDLTILDDLENDTNVRSKPQRDKLEEWLDEAVLNLGSADRSMDILYIGTILHRDSVLARKLKLQFWNPKKFQSVITFPKRMDLWDRYGFLYKNMGTHEAEAFYLKHKAEMDEGAEVLWKEALPINKLMQIRAENPKAFNKEQMNNPLGEAQKFKKENMHFYITAPKCDRHIMWVDPAGEKKKSDYTAITVLGIKDIERKGYVLESKVKVMPAREIINTVIKLQQLYRCKIIGVETNGGQFFLKGWMLEAAFDAGVHLPLRGMDNYQNKEARIEELELPIENGEIMFHKSHTLLIEQLEEFPEGEHDDAPDSLHGAYKLSKLEKSKNKKKKRTNRIIRKRPGVMDD